METFHISGTLFMISGVSEDIFLFKLTRQMEKIVLDFD